MVSGLAITSGVDVDIKESIVTRYLSRSGIQSSGCWARGRLTNQVGRKSFNKEENIDF